MQESAGGRMPDHTAWHEILQKYVSSDSRVAYRALKETGAAQLDGYIQRLAAPWPGEIGGDARKAALINGYNALTVRWIVTHYPVESIWRTRRPFTEPRHVLDGRKASLDQIEGWLRDSGDPRIHAALVCAARSCPPLRREAYLPSRLDGQLDENVRAWLSDTTLNEFFPDRRLASVSPILKWYRTDFERGGASEAEFLARFGPFGRTDFLRRPGASIVYKTYHWGLNDTTGLGAKYSQIRFYWDAIVNKLR